MSERDGLRGARVRGAGHDRLGVLARARDERPHEHRDEALDPAAGGEHPQPEIGDDQIVAAPPGVQPGSDVPQPVRDAALDRGVHVLVRLVERELPFRDLASHLGERFDERPRLLRRQQPGPLQAVDVRDGRVDVVRSEPHVELHAASERVRFGRRRRREPAGPERLAGGAAGLLGPFSHAPPCFADQTLSGSP